MNDMEILVRQHYLDRIEKYLGKDTIVVLTGQRRVGKSYTLKMIRDIKAKDENNLKSATPQSNPILFPSVLVNSFAGE